MAFPCWLSLAGSPWLQIMEIASFEKFLVDKIKVGGKTGEWSASGDITYLLVCTYFLGKYLCFGQDPPMRTEAEARPRLRLGRGLGGWLMATTGRARLPCFRAAALPATHPACSLPLVFVAAVVALCLARCRQRRPLAPLQPSSQLSSSSSSTARGSGAAQQLAS